jgi:hypothetical protein
VRWTGVGAGVGALMPAAREVYKAATIPRSSCPGSLTTQFCDLRWAGLVRVIRGPMELNN